MNLRNGVIHNVVRFLVVAMVFGIALSGVYAKKGGGGKPGGGSPADPAIVFGGHDQPIWVINADGSNKTQVLDFGYRPKLSPDGRIVAAGGENGALILADIDVVDGNISVLGTSVVRSGSFGYHHHCAFHPSGSHLTYGESLDEWDSVILSTSLLNGDVTVVYDPDADVSFRNTDYSRDGSQLAVIENNNEDSERRIYIRVLDLDKFGQAFADTIVYESNNPGAGGLVMGLSWARTSDHIYFGDSDDTTKILDLDTGIVEVQSPNVGQSLSPDDSKIVYIQHPGSLMTLDLTTGSTEIITRKGGGIPHWKR